MNIDFPPPSNGTYNNAGSSRRLADYLEHEDLERMEQGIYTEGFFNLTDDNIYKSQVIKDIDSNIGQLLKTDAKFYAIHVSPSEKELRAIGSTEAEQAETMKRYIREVIIPEYAKNFNKGLSAEDIKFYGKIHFDRDGSDNELNMHCHLIVSRKDQTNKKKLSPLTNHKNTKKGAITGGFDRTNLFRQAEQGFDKLFNYNRPLSESFEYYNTMKNGSISDQLNIQEKVIKQPQDSPQNVIPDEKEKKQAVNHGDDLGLSSVLGVLTPTPSNSDEEQPIKRQKKKKIPKRGIKR
jgi:ribosomal protein S15P/S13E